MSMYILAVALILLFATCAPVDSKCYLRNGSCDDTSKPGDFDAEASRCYQKGLQICLSTPLCLDLLNNHLIEGRPEQSPIVGLHACGLS